MLLKLGPLGHFKLTRDISGSSLPQRNVTDASCQTDGPAPAEVPDMTPNAIHDDPFPSYSTSSHAVCASPKEVEPGVLLDANGISLKEESVPTERPEYVVPPGAQKSPDAVNQLRRYLMEIMAFTLDVNFDELNSTLYKQPVTSNTNTSNTNTILTDKEREELLHLSRLVQKSCEKLRRIQISTITRHEKIQVYTAVSDPSHVLTPAWVRTRPHRIICRLCRRRRCRGRASHQNPPRVLDTQSERVDNVVRHRSRSQIVAKQLRSSDRSNFLS
jgi:hypothetical protein